MNSVQRYRIVLIEPSQILRTGLASMLEPYSEFSIVSSLPDLSYYNPARSDACDLMIVNPAVVDYARRADVRPLLSSGGAIQLVALSYHPYEESVLRQFDGCIYINDTKEQIVKKLKAVLENVKPVVKTESNELSARERSILTAVAQGKTNKEIADEFNLSVYTVVTHRKNISNKLGINTISGLTVYAVLNKLIDLKDF